MLAREYGTWSVVTVTRIVVVTVKEAIRQRLALDVKLAEERLVRTPPAVLVEDVDKETEALEETTESFDHERLNDELDDTNEVDDVSLGPIELEAAVDEVTIGVATQEQALEIWLGSLSHMFTKSGRQSEGVFIAVVYA